MSELRLTSTEIANLWNSFINDSMAICVKRHILKHLQDDEMKPVFEYGLELAQGQVEFVATTFKTEEIPIPIGFREEDVNLNAPRLFSDAFWLYALCEMTIHGLTGYSIGISTSTRSDIREFFGRCHHSATELFNKIVDLTLSKGLYSRPPFISPPNKAEYVKRQGFLSGWLQGQRPLNSIEISNIFFNLKKDIFDRTLRLGFSQVAKNQEVRQYLARGADMTSKHINVFSSLLHDSNLPSPKRMESEITNSTIAPFSDKLMMYHLQFLTAAAIGFYGAGMAACMRRDLAVQYQGAITETQKYSEDGANIMINHGWMEKPPQADDRKELARV